MLCSSLQSRAGRALLNWSQDDLATHARLAKRTIANFEGDARMAHPETAAAIAAALQDAGVILIPEGDEGVGVRIKKAQPRLIQRNDVPYREWVAFAFSFRGQSTVGFITYNALGLLGLSNDAPVKIFDQFRDRVLRIAADKFDRKALDDGGRVLIDRLDVDVVTYNF